MPSQSERKVAFAATRAVGNSVVRHRYTRKLREFYRLNKSLFAGDGHYFLLVRRPVQHWPEFEVRLRDILASICG